MLERVISGFQTGADQGAIRAAKAIGLPTGGWMPLGWLTEEGARPEFRELYGAVEMPTSDLRARTRKNVEEASATIWFGRLKSPGSLATHKACLEYGRSCFDVDEKEKPSSVVRWIRMNSFKSLNCAGNRESSNPGIGARTERFMLAVLRKLAEE
jgi:Circularly permutated YpsA SLOG family